MKWLLIIGVVVAAVFGYAQAHLSNLPVAGALPADSVLAQTKTIAGHVVNVYSSAGGFYVQTTLAGQVRTLGPLSNLDVTRILQLQTILGGL